MTKLTIKRLFRERIPIWYNSFEGFVVFLIKILTTYSLPVILVWTLYHLYNFNLERVVGGCLVIYILIKVNIAIQGGEDKWQRRNRYR